MREKIFSIVFLAAMFAFLVAFYLHASRQITIEPIPQMEDADASISTPVVPKTPTSQKTPAQSAKPTAFFDDFSDNYTVTETGDINESKSSEWWLGSGAYFYSKDGAASTVEGPLPIGDYFRNAFSLSNPLDTDGGYYPQNIFRLVQRIKSHDFEQQAYFKITKDNLSDSPNRNASNGLLLFNRYQDEFNLYYTGIRVDGYAVIKKKMRSVYYTMAYQPLLTGPAYDRVANPNLLPKNIWIGLKSEVKSLPDKSVNIKLYTDIGKTGKWTLSAEATDSGATYGDAPITIAGYGGIRTDFMDVEFDDYSVVQK